MESKMDEKIEKDENNCFTEEETVTAEAVQDTEQAAEATENNADKNDECEHKCSGKESKKAKKLEAEIEKLKASIAEEQDKYLRLYAEYDNFRRRSAKEKESVYTDAAFDTLNEILPILDNLERAATFTAEDADSPMAKGLELTLKSFIETLNKLGVYEIEALGKPFDPNFHNAVMHVEDETVEESTVVEVFMKGYAKGDKVLRYSMVKVAN